MNLLRTTTAAIALAALTLVGQQPANAIKMYRDLETGGLYTAPGENREEFKPFGLDIGFTFFLQYRSELEDRDQPAGTAYATKNTATAPFDEFSATRTVVDIRRSFGSTRRARLVLDSRGTSTPAAGHAYNVYVRHVIGEFDFPSLSSTLSVGEIPLPTISYDDAFWGYRVQGTSFTEREGLLTSGDWGIGWHWKPTGLPIDWNTTFTNGEGRTTVEANIGKTLESRLTWKTPIDGLQLSGFGHYSQGGNFIGNPNTGVGIKQTRFGGGLYYRQPFWRIAATGVWSRDEANSYANAATLLNNNVANMNRQSIPTAGFATTEIASRGWSAMGVYDIAGTEWSLLGRYDWFDPGTFYKDNEHSRWLAGPAYKLNDHVTVLATYEVLDFKQGAERASGNITANAFDQSRLLVQAQITF